MMVQGPIFRPPGKPKIIQNQIFGPRSAQEPSKNDIWKVGSKKHDKSMKNRCKDQCFLIVQNHVWRYTLRLFHTFAIFEKSRKIDAKREPKSRGFCSKNRPWALQIDENTFLERFCCRIATRRFSCIHFTKKNKLVQTCWPKMVFQGSIL